MPMRERFQDLKRKNHQKNIKRQDENGYASQLGAQEGAKHAKKHLQEGTENRAE